MQRGPTSPSLACCSISASMPQSQVACVNAEAEAPVRADLLFGLLADPTKHEEVFSSIEGASSRLLHEAGPKRRFQLDYQARWKFWRISGVCENRLWMETDSDAGTVSFKLREPGFLRTYEGTWRITPVGQTALNMHLRSQQPPAPLMPASTPMTQGDSPPQSPRWAAGLLSGLQQNNLTGFLASLGTPMRDPTTSSTPEPLVPSTEPHAPSFPRRSVLKVEGLRMSPKVAPPYPLGGLLKNHAASQVEDMMKGLVAAASKLQDQMDDDAARTAAASARQLAAQKLGDEERAPSGPPSPWSGSARSSGQLAPSPASAPPSARNSFGSSWESRWWGANSGPCAVPAVSRALSNVSGGAVVPASLAKSVLGGSHRISLSDEWVE